MFVQLLKYRCYPNGFSDADVGVGFVFLFLMLLALSPSLARCIERLLDRIFKPEGTPLWRKDFRMEYVPPETAEERERGYRDGS